VFPLSLYQLSARDLTGPLVDLIYRSQIINSVATVVSTGVLYTVPLDKLLVLTNFSLFCLPLAGNHPRGLTLNLQGPSFSPFGHEICPIQAPSLTAGGLATGWTGELVIPEGTQLSMNMTAAAMLAAQDFKFSLSGFTIPEGNVHG
jgi:hypothetical protein